MELMGKCGVDSGQLLITDPCYLKDWKSDEYEILEEYTLEAVEDCEYSKDGISVTIKKGITFKICSTKGIWFYIVDLINSGKLKTLKTEFMNTSKDYSYNGACSATLSEKQGGELGDGTGVAVSTGYGDGTYNVYAKKENGRVKQVVIKFF